MEHLLNRNIGIGIDIVDIARFRKISFSIKKSFYKRIFLESEIKYCLRFKDPSTHFAAKFAIKEAVKKSIQENIDFLDVETFHLRQKPAIRLKSNKKYIFILSVSHDKNIATAVVISEKID